MRDGWKTRDLAARLVVRERRADAAGGLLAVSALKARLERVQAEFAAKPYEELIQLIRTGPPRFSPMALKQVDEAANTVEFFVHAEDVRRAQPDWSRRELNPVFADVLWSNVEKTARLVGRRSPVGLVLRRPTAGRRWPTRHPVVTVTGEPAELLLFAYGRQTRGGRAGGGRPGSGGAGTEGRTGDVDRVAGPVVRRRFCRARRPR